MPYCTKCGAQISDSDRFCAICGNPVTEQENAALQVQPQTQLQTPNYDNGSSQKPGRGLGVAGMVLGITSLLYGFVFFILAIRTAIQYSMDFGYNWYESTVDASGPVPLVLFFAVLPVLAVSFSATAKSKGNNTGINKAGLITSIISLLLFFFSLMIYLFI